MFFEVFLEKKFKITYRISRDKYYDRTDSWEIFSTNQIHSHTQALLPLRFQHGGLKGKRNFKIVRCYVDSERNKTPLLGKKDSESFGINKAS